jgi:MFS family permease
MTDRHRRAMRFVVTMGVVSLFADMVYEGLRSGAGAYLGLLGASAASVGFIGGLGEAIGYGLRWVSGKLADRTQRYWALTIAGYALTGLAVPAVALAPGPWTVALLVALERLGKAVRSPAKATILSFAAAEVGEGKGFGIHQALDQIGAVLGPLVVGAVLLWRGEDVSGYQWAFGLLIVPAAITMTTLLVARRRYPDPRVLAPPHADDERRPLGRLYGRYLIGAALMAAGLADWLLLSLHLGPRTGEVPLEWLQVVYAIAMGADAITALVVGHLYDRSRARGKSGVGVLATVAAVGAAYAPLVFLAPRAGALAGVALWAAVAAATDSIGKAVVSQLTPTAQRGRAFGGYYAVYGLAWWAGSFVTGELYDHSRAAAAGFACACMLAGAAVLASVARAATRMRAASGAQSRA